MKITEDPWFRAKVIEKIRAREFGERTGVHQSDLNYCLNRQAFRRLAPKGDTDRETLIFSLGYSTQRWLTGMDKDEPEMEVDGIKVTTDCVAEGDEYTAINTPTGVVYSNELPWELKATFTSSSKPIEENVAWLRQIMAECYVRNTTQAKLTRFCLMGNWLWVWNGRAKPAKLAELVKEHGENWDDHPVLQAYNLEFTEEEIARNWRWLLERRTLFLQVIESGKALPKAVSIPSGQEYECKWCAYTKECEEGGLSIGGVCTCGDCVCTSNNNMQ
uniref:PD-(D/E)XK nuclease superfamily protein n=1 Tax=viral metagenome TaxID=1070528 RepID=A0A6M3K602_9ZZZZ